MAILSPKIKIFWLNFSRQNNQPILFCRKNLTQQNIKVALILPRKSLPDHPRKSHFFLINPWNFYIFSPFNIPFFPCPCQLYFSLEIHLFCCNQCKQVFLLYYLLLLWYYYIFNDLLLYFHFNYDCNYCYTSNISIQRIMQEFNLSIVSHVSITF